MYRRFFAYALMVSMALAALPAGAKADEQSITVSMTNFVINILPLNIHSGRAQFTIENDAADTMHEFFLVKTDFPPNELPLESDGKIDEDSRKIHKIITAEDINPGESVSVSVKLRPGHYVYFCNIDGHHMMGMLGEFTVRDRHVDE